MNPIQRLIYLLLTLVFSWLSGELFRGPDAVDGLMALGAVMAALVCFGAAVSRSETPN